jgi:enamine deaminase RidA (YjgF/YER057c/UK114 family)
MQRVAVGSGSPWEAAVGYSRVVRTGPFVAVAGTTGTGADGRVVSDDPYAQARHALDRIVAALESVGAKPEHVVRTRMFVTDVRDWPAVGRAHGERFSEIRPAATLVQVSALVDPAMKVEIEADAVVPG